MPKDPIPRTNRFFDGVFSDFGRKTPPWLLSAGLHALVGLLLSIGPFSFILIGGGHRYGPELMLRLPEFETGAEPEVTVQRNLVEEDGEEIVEPLPEAENPEQEELGILRKPTMFFTSEDRDDEAAKDVERDAPFQGKYWNAAIGSDWRM
jgi:hypothetical protein